MIQKGNFRAHLELHSISHLGHEAMTFTHTHEKSATHAEFMTHRKASRQGSSSRAIPLDDMIAWIDRDPAMPLHLGIKKKGMQSGKAIDTIKETLVRRLLRGNYFVNRAFALTLSNVFGLHKEICNRYIEQYGWINMVSTWDRPGFMNYIALRCTPFAEPRIQRLAISMLREYKASIPQRLNFGDWHIPFVKDKWLVGTCKNPAPNLNINCCKEVLQELLVWSTARAAWCSYQTVDGKEGTWESASRRHDDCVKLKHVTPVEHQLRVNAGETTCNIIGYDQYRKMIPGEMTTDVDIDAILDLYDGVDFLTVE